MGLETFCEVVYDGVPYAMKVLLETEALVFRGPLKKTIPFAAMSGLEAYDGALGFTLDGVRVEVHLGPKSCAWMDKIKNPRRLIDKLGVKQGEAVVVLGMDDTDFHQQLSERTTNVLNSVPDGPVRWVFLQTDQTSDLDRLGDLRRSLEPAGAIWVIHPKGRQDLKDLHVFAAAKSAGLVDVKVSAFSATHSAIKLMIPRSLR
jgi:hypothetical protein